MQQLEGRARVCKLVRCHMLLRLRPSCLALCIQCLHALDKCDHAQRSVLYAQLLIDMSAAKNATSCRGPPSSIQRTLTRKCTKHQPCPRAQQKSQWLDTELHLKVRRSACTKCTGSLMPLSLELW